jgi:hypothetical protein
MSLSQLGSARTFQNHAQGTVGDFRTPAGRVKYIMTKARLGADATDPERRLTQHLVPVREVIPSEELDFNQLLQRDLDDHRVAVNLIPYLLSPQWTGPAFFPPIIAIALPFKGQQPSEFPDLEEAAHVVEDGLHWQQRDAGLHLRTRQLVVDNGESSPVALGQLWWNGEFCRIVVVDGQHRAMALLAIDRTVRNTWQESTGGRYRYFYETRVRNALGEHNAALDDIEVPVTILWFPDKFGPGQEPHKAARKIFVDVNKEARAPSESRLILLSDGELVNILTRTTLTQLRNQASDAFLPLYSVEYDNPDTKTTQSARWSALTNIHILKQMVTRSIFGPPRYINDVTVPIGRREPEEEKNAFMRTQLGVDALFPPNIGGDQPFLREHLGNKNFPEAAVGALAGAYRDTWSAALLTLLSEILPFKAHARALARLKKDWLQDDAIAALAYDALFSGVGMFWTLKDSWSFWHDEVEGSPGDSKNKPDVVKAWDLIGAKQSDFESLRAEELLGNRNQQDAANQLYQAVNTHACQLGLALTLATLHRRACGSSVAVVSLAQRMADGINAWMASRTAGAYDRRLALSKRREGSPRHAFNVISNMDMPRAVQFRYFWLEILASGTAMEILGDMLDEGKLMRLRDEARGGYIAYVAGEKEKALRTTAPTLSASDRQERSVTEAEGEIRQAIIKWFDISAPEVDEWLRSRRNAVGQAASTAAQDDVFREDDEPLDAEDIEDVS